MKLHFLMMGFDEDFDRNEEKTFLVSAKFRDEDDLLKRNPDTIDGKEYLLHEMMVREEFDTQADAEDAVRFIMDHADDLDAITDYFNKQREKNRS